MNINWKIQITILKLRCTCCSSVSKKFEMLCAKGIFRNWHNRESHSGSVNHVNHRKLDVLISASVENLKRNNKEVEGKEVLGSCMNPENFRIPRKKTGAKKYKW